MKLKNFENSDVIGFKQLCCFQSFPYFNQQLTIKY